jgi:hypothetical protein
MNLADIDRMFSLLERIAIATEQIQYYIQKDSWKKENVEMERKRIIEEANRRA